MTFLFIAIPDFPTWYAIRHRYRFGFPAPVPPHGGLGGWGALARQPTKRAAGPGIIYLKKNTSSQMLTRGIEWVS